MAKIIKIVDDYLHLEYPNDLIETNRVIDRWSIELAPFESKTKENYEWK